MPTNNLETTISITSNSRRALIADLCAELNAALTTDHPWERGSTLYPWQATATSFEELPARVLEAVLEEWGERDRQHGEIECSGYMETDEGSRAWGFLAVHENMPSRERRPIVDHVSVTVSAETCRFEARIRRIPIQSNEHNA